MKSPCCRCFVLSVAWQDLLLDNEKRKRGERYRFKDNWIADHIRPLGVFTRHPFERHALGEPSEYFECTLLGDDGLCTVYNDRPFMCRHYGIKTQCMHWDHCDNEQCKNALLMAHNADEAA